MKKFIVTKTDEGQRLIKYSSRILDKAPMSVIRKALRKKNIDLNKKKADGNELLKAGDVIQIWFSDETFEKFMSSSENEGQPGKSEIKSEKKVDKRLKEKFKDWLVYEDENILIINKPAGLLTQSDDSKEISLNDILLGYYEDLADYRTFKPSICNRLDRNTSGMVIAGKTIKGLQKMNEIIKTREVRKIYKCIAFGEIKEAADLKGWLKKDKTKNTVRIYDNPTEDAVEIETIVEPLIIFKKNGINFTLAEVELVTGRPHQIRAHLSHIGNPLMGDKKYGSRDSIVFSEKLSVRRQMLHAARLEFPTMGEEFEALSEMVIEVPIPADMEKLVE